MVSFFPHLCQQLPDFQSLLVRGSYHASAPIHLLLSHTTESPETRAILLTPDRQCFKNDLVHLNDQWIDRQSGSGRHAAAAQRTQIYYPPTIAHLRLLLSMLHEYDDSVHHAKTTLEAVPTLLVLHEVSAYFNAQASEATVSSYLSIMSSALSLTASWSPRSSTTSRLVIFDSGLSALKLPILRSLSFDESDGGGSARLDTLSALLERYIEWEAEFPEDESYDTQTDEHTARHASERKSLKLRRINGVDLEKGDLDANVEQAEEVVWTWTEGVTVGEDGIERTTFTWD